MGKKLYVGNFVYTTTTMEVEQMFAACGTVASVQLITDRDTGQNKGFGFVEMSSDAEADAAIAALNGKELGGRALTVNEAKPRENRRSNASRHEYGGGNNGQEGTHGIFGAASINNNN